MNFIVDFIEIITETVGFFITSLFKPSLRTSLVMMSANKMESSFNVAKFNTVITNGAKSHYMIQNLSKKNPILAMIISYHNDNIYDFCIMSI